MKDSYTKPKSKKKQWYIVAGVSIIILGIVIGVLQNIDTGQEKMGGETIPNLDSIQDKQLEENPNLSEFDDPETQGRDLSVTIIEKVGVEDNP